jgi:hypothetical protein
MFRKDTAQNSAQICGKAEIFRKDASEISLKDEANVS